MGQALGFGLTENIEDAYNYLMDRYQPGTKCFLSASAGARTPCEPWPACSIRSDYSRKAA
jgi:hypothetical protein